MSQQLIKVTEQAKKAETKKATTTKTKKVYKKPVPKDITIEDVKLWVSVIEESDALNQYLTRQPNAKDDKYIKGQIAQVAQKVNAINFNGEDLKQFFIKTKKALKD